MNDFAGSADQIAKQLVAGGMEPDRAMMMALRMAQSRQQADQSILGGVPTQPPVSDVPPATEILGGDPSKLFQRQPTTMERVRDLPKDVLGAGEALVSMGSLAALAPASMLYALRPGQKTQGDPMEFALRNMYMPRSERGPSHLAGLGEVLESLPQTGPLPELQAFTGLGRGVGRQLAEKGRQAGRAMAPAAANVVEDILRRQGLLMDVVKPKGGNWIAGSVEEQLKPLKPQGPTHYDEALMLGGNWADWARTPEGKSMMAQNEAISNWIDRNLTNYVKKEMATPEDPVRKLAEQGVVHIPAEQVGRNRYRAPGHRQQMGGEQLGKSEAAQAWEDASDVAVLSTDLKNWIRGSAEEEIEPWMKKADPKTPLYYASDNLNAQDLGFDHIVDVLRQDLAEGRIRPEQLNKVSMEQAVRRTYEYDQEMAKKMREAQIKATEGMPTFKEYPEQGFKWVELKAKEPESLPEGVKRVQQSVTQGGLEVPGVGFVLAKWDPKKGLDWEQAEREAKKLLAYEPTEKALKYEGETMGHCVGGYCPDVLEGRSRIFSLRDAKGEPHVTVEVAPKRMVAMTPSQFYQSRDVPQSLLNKIDEAEKAGDLNDIGSLELIVENSPEYKAYLQSRPATQEIVQIKGKQNRKPKDEYLPFVQDFVRSGNWTKVGDPQNAGLRRYTDVFNDAEQRKIEALNLPVPDHMWLTGEEIQTLHNAINPEGKRLKYNASGQIIGDSYKQGGSVNHKAIASARRALEKAMAKGGEVKMGTGGSMLGTIAGKAAAAGKAGAKAAKAAKSDDEKTLPMVLQRAPAKTKQELQAEAERVGRQIIGEHVTKPGDTANLADYSKKVSERLRAMQEGQDYVLKETKPTSPLANIDPATGSILIGLPGDISIADKELMKLGKLKVGSKQEGGPRYGAAFTEDPVEMAKFWASNYGPANIFQNKVTELGGMYPERDILGAYMSMGRTGMNFAQHFADANLKAIRSAIKAGDVSKDDIESFNKMIREGWSKINQKTGEREYFKYPDFAGVEKTGEAYAQMMRDPELRKWFNDRMKTGKETAPRGLPSGLDIEYAISEPELRNLEHSLVGFSLGRMQPGRELIAPVEHATYSHGIPGQAVGRLAGHVPARIAFPDASKVIAETKRPQDFTGTIQKVFPHQVVDQQWQDEVGQYLDYLKRITGRKKGGLMKTRSSKLPKKVKGGKVGGLSALRK